MRLPLSIEQSSPAAPPSMVAGPPSSTTRPPRGGPRPAATYGTLAARVAGLAAYLDELGVGPGQRVAVAAPNSARALELYCAVPATGRSLVPINFRLSRDEIGFIVRHSGSSPQGGTADSPQPVAERGGFRTARRAE